MPVALLRRHQHARAVPEPFPCHGRFRRDRPYWFEAIEPLKVFSSSAAERNFLLLFASRRAQVFIRCRFSVRPILFSREPLF